LTDIISDILLLKNGGILFLFWLDFRIMDIFNNELFYSIYTNHNAPDSWLTKWWHPILKGDKQDSVVMAGQA